LNYLSTNRTLVVNADESFLGWLASRLKSDSSNRADNGNQLRGCAKSNSFNDNNEFKIIMMSSIDQSDSNSNNMTDAGRRARAPTNFYHVQFRQHTALSVSSQLRRHSFSASSLQQQGKPMTDNLANSWGTNLVFLNPRDQRKNVNTAVTLLRAAIRRSTDDKFTLSKITSCGSDANLFAVAEASFGNTDAVLVACGMYVAGDRGPIQQWSTSGFDLLSGPASIVPPHLTKTKFVHQHVVALPYYIPFEQKDINETVAKELIEYEDRCLHELHIRLLLNKLNGRAVQVLFLELLLSGNGAELSDRVLERLGQLSKHHGFTIVVDEIFTGGRCGSMLLTQQKPQSFQTQVSHITMGKWTQAGLVLSSEAFKLQLDKLMENFPSRGPSTEVSATPIYLSWELVDEHLVKTAERRAKVIAHLHGITEDECWGKGVIVYAPVKRSDIAAGLKNRFLPMLESTPLDRFRWERYPSWEKKPVNDMVMNGVQIWCDHMRSAWENDVRKIFCEYVAMAFIGKHPFTNTKDMKDQLCLEWLKEPLELAQLKDILKDAEESNIVSKKVRTSKRIKGWEIAPIAVTPWRLLQKHKGSEISTKCNEEEQTRGHPIAHVTEESKTAKPVKAKTAKHTKPSKPVAGKRKRMANK
jgi:hypothetical protein